MPRLTRAQRQELTRDAVLRAAGHEFAAHGYQDAKIDRIAARADLTRGAVYSNFPSKRALYLAVLLDLLEHDTSPGRQNSLAGALGAFVRVWLERLPLAGDPPAAARLRLRSLAGVFEDDLGRATLAQVARLEGVLLGLALEQFPDEEEAGGQGTPGGGTAPRGGEAGGRDPRGEAAEGRALRGWEPGQFRRPGESPGRFAREEAARGRRVRLAELVLTLLAGACQLAERAPGFGDPFDVIQASRHLAGLDLDDEWAPPYLDFTGAARQVWEPWRPPDGVRDELTGRPVDLGTDGVIVVLGTQRLEAAEEAVRAARPDDQVTVVVATADPAELGRLVRLRVGDLAGCLRVLEVGVPLRLVLDEDLAVTSAVLGRAGGDGRGEDGRGEDGRGEDGRDGRGRVDHGRGDHGRGDHGRDDDGRGDDGRDDHGRDDHGSGDNGRVVGVGRPPDGGPEPDELEIAIRIHNGEIIARAEGRGAAHAVAEVRP
ncbi:TetR family transcriptional regulator [Nonomuraea sp. NPDC050663]|uniref:TetR family transcriptional regulator n=1 Tax=Nonomuraea sp. NPDC050663 TaxID=3364370 RepID=UPI0037A1DE1F